MDNNGYGANGVSSSVSNGLSNGVSGGLSSGSDGHHAGQNVGLLSLVNNLKNAIEINHNKKIEDFELKLMEKDEIIGKLEAQVSELKSASEKLEMENFRLEEEIKASKKVLEELVGKLGS